MSVSHSKVMETKCQALSSQSSFISSNLLVQRPDLLTLLSDRVTSLSLAELKTFKHKKSMDRFKILSWRSTFNATVCWLLYSWKVLPMGNSCASINKKDEN